MMKLPDFHQEIESLNAIFFDEIRCLSKEFFQDLQWDWIRRPHYDNSYLDQSTKN